MKTKKKTPIQRINETKKKLKEMIKNRKHSIFYIAMELYMGDLPRDDFDEIMEQTLFDIQTYEEIIRGIE